MMPIMDMWAWVRETFEPLTREVKSLREEVRELKHENAERQLEVRELHIEVRELKHELAELKVQQAHASAAQSHVSAQVLAQAQLQTHASAPVPAQAEAQAQAQAQAEVQTQAQAQSDIVKWRRRGCVIQGLEVHPDKAPPTRCKAKFTYNCFDEHCSFKNRDLALDSYIKHLKDKHHKNIRDLKMTETERNLYLPIRSNY